MWDEGVSVYHFRTSKGPRCGDYRCGGGDGTGSGSRARSPSAVAEVLAEWLEAHRR